MSPLPGWKPEVMLKAQFSFARRITLLLAAINLMLLLAAAAGLLRLRDAQGRHTRLIEQDSKALLTIPRIHAVLHDAAGVARQRANAATPDELARLDRELAAVGARMTRETAALRAALPDRSQVVSDFDRAFGVFMGVAVQMRGPGVSSGADRAQQQQHQQQVRAQFSWRLERLQTFLQALGDQIRDRILGEARASEAWANRVSRQTLWVAVLVVGGGLFVARWWVRRFMAQPLGELVTTVRRLAAGDVNAPIPGVGRTDEIGVMASALVMLRQTLAKRRQLEDADRETPVPREPGGTGVESGAGRGSESSFADRFGTAPGPGPVPPMDTSPDADLASLVHAGTAFTMIPKLGMELGAEPEEERVQDPVVEVARDPAAKVGPEPVVEVVPEPVVEVAQEPVVEVVPEPEVEVVPEPVVEVVQEPVVKPVPEPVVEVPPEPVAEVAPEPVVEAVQEPGVEAAAEPVPEGVPEPAVEPVPEPAMKRRGSRRRKAGSEIQLELLGPVAEADPGVELPAVVHQGRLPGVDVEDAVQRLGLSGMAVEGLLGPFAEEQSRTVRELRRATESGDREEARRLAHELAGAAGHLSVHELRRHAKTVELAIKFGQANLGGMLRELEAEAARVFAGIGRLAEQGPLEAAPAAPVGEPGVGVGEPGPSTEGSGPGDPGDGGRPDRAA